MGSHPCESWHFVSSKRDLFSLSSRIHPFPLSSMENNCARQLGEEKTANNYIQWNVSPFRLLWLIWEPFQKQAGQVNGRAGVEGRCTGCRPTSCWIRRWGQESRAVLSQALGPGAWFWNLKPLPPSFMTLGKWLSQSHFASVSVYERWLQ